MAKKKYVVCFLIVIFIVLSVVLYSSLKPGAEKQFKGTFVERGEIVERCNTIYKS